jgi:rubrerythrin
MEESMGNIFAGSEVVEIAVQIEKNGRDFYRVLMNMSKDPKALDMYKYLSGEEEKHIVVFQKMLESIGQYDAPEAYPDEYVAYMKALASEHVFTQEGKGAELAKKVKTDKEAIDMGIGFEKDSIIFYEGMKKAVPEYDLKIIDELILQEQGHLRKLSELKQKI